MSKMLFRSLGLAGGSLIAALAPAAANAVTYFQSASTGNDRVQGTSTAPTTYTATQNGYATTTASEANGTSSSAQAIANSTAFHTQFAQAQSYITYNIQAVGDPNTMVLMHMHATGYAQASGESYGAESSVRVSPASGQDYLIEAYANGIYGNYNSFDVNADIWVDSNYDTLITTISFAYAGGYSSYSGSAYAYVDPTFTIDAAFADRFTLTGVPGLTASAVPEPTVWAMMIGGFGLVGATMRRRKPAVSFG